MRSPFASDESCVGWPRVVEGLAAQMLSVAITQVRAVSRALLSKEHTVFQRHLVILKFCEVDFLHGRIWKAPKAERRGADGGV